MTLIAQTNTTSAINLSGSPIPVTLISEGSPVGRIWIATQSPDLKVTQGVWDCTAGTWSWEYGWDEFVMILEGEAVISPKDGKPFTLRVGDFAHFPLGLEVEWHVPKYVKKTFVLRTPEPFKL
jgi:uncharacterized protein